MAADGHVVINLSFESGDAVGGIKKLLQAFEQLAGGAEDAIDDVNEELDKLGDGVDSSEVEKEIEDIGDEADKTSEKLKDVDKQKKKAVSPLKKMGDVFGGAFGSLADFSGTFLSGALKGAASGISMLGDRVKSKFEGIKELIGHIGEKLLDVFIFDLMNQALDKTREKLGEIIAEDERLSKQINTIKGNISAAFAPLWNAVYPTVVKILNVVTAITSAIANLSAKVFGSAAVATDALKGEADAFGAVAEAAGSASQELGGFDEINTLPSSSGGGAGGDGAGGDLEDILATDLSTTFEDLHDRLMAINWEDVGKRISKALADIDFTKIGAKIAGGADYIMSAFRTVVAEINWKELGEDLAGGVDLIIAELPDLVATLTEWYQGAIELFYGFVTTFDWKGLGTAIKDGINNFFTGIDWKLVGLTLSRFIIGLGDTIITAVLGIDKDAIFQAIKDLLAGIDWMGIAKLLGELLLVAMINGLEMFTPVGWGLKGAQWLGLTDFDPSDWAMDAFYGNTTDGANESTRAVEEFGNTSEWLSGNLDKLGVSTDNVGGSMDNAASSADRASSAVNRVKANTAALANVQQTATKKTEKTTNAIEDENEALKETDKAAATAVLSNLSVALSHQNMVKTTSTGVITMDEALQNNLKGWEEYASKLTSIMATISTKQTQFWAKMSSAATSAANGIKNSFNSLPTHLSNAFSRAWQAIVSALTSDNGLKAFENGLEDVFKDSINELIVGLNKVFDKVETQLNQTLTTLKRLSVNGSKPFAGLQMVSLPEIPKLAQGAVIPANKEFLAILGDQKHGTNIEAPLDTIVEAMEISLQRNGSGNATAIASAVRAALMGMSVTFDGERVGRVVAAQIDANRRADGKFAYDLA